MQILLTLAVASLGGYVFSLMHVPLAWTIGAMAASAVLAWLRPVSLPKQTRPVAMVLLGASFGVGFTAPVLTAVLAELPVIACAGVLIILMGLNFLGILRIPLLSREARFQSQGKPASALAAYVMGLAFAFGWTPCIGPVLGAILGIAASRETVGSGAGLLAIYSLGLAIPFWIAAGFSGAFMRFLVRFRRHLGTVEKILGGLLVLTGLAFMFGFISQAAIWFQQTFPILMQIG